MEKKPAAVSVLPRKINWNGKLSPSMTLDWLNSAWSDFKHKPMISLVYGLIVFLVSVLLVSILFTTHRDYILLPAVAGFMVIGPAFAIGLYEKSKRIAEGKEVDFRNTFPNWRHSGGQVLFIGVVLLLLVLIWIRSAILLYAIFFGGHLFGGVASVIQTLISTPTGISLLVVGTAVGGLIAVFAFAISIFSIPMLLVENTDVLTATGTSVVLVWKNLSTMLVWGGIVLILFLISCLTGFIGLIIIFPLLGHATWHAYEAVQVKENGAAKEN